MKHLKLYLSFIIATLFFLGCGSYTTKRTTKIKEEPVVISNKKLEYQIIIIDPGFTTFLNSEARAKNYYSNSYLKTKNQRYVSVWNSRVRNPQKYSSNIYENIINYNPKLDYGLDVNHKLYWYFKFAEKKYKMKLDF